MKITIQLRPITPTELFKQQINNAIGNARAVNTGVSPIPAQFGGLYGQRSTLEESLLVSVTNIDGRV